MKSGGIDIIRFGSYQGGLYHDSHPTEDIPIGWGLRLAILWGPLLWNMPKFWKRDAWLDRNIPENIWFTINLPIMAGPLLSVGLKKYGFYIGFKQIGWKVNDTILFTARMTQNRRI